MQGHAAARRGWIGLGLALALAGCLAQTGGQTGKTAGDALLQGGIEVQALAPLAQATDAAAPLVTPASDRPVAQSPSGVIEAPVPASPAKTPAQISCEMRRGALWTKTPTGPMACVQRSRDNGKSCRSAEDCEGACLARSGSCAPFVPLFGCNDILDDLGRRMTQCLQ